MLWHNRADAFTLCVFSSVSCAVFLPLTFPPSMDLCGFLYFPIYFNPVDLTLLACLSYKSNLGHLVLGRLLLLVGPDSVPLVLPPNEAHF